VPQGAAPADSLSITYLGNEGFLVEARGRKILVDALHGPHFTGYVSLSDEQRRPLEEGRPPFDGVALAVATHHHGDHFDPHAVGRYLEQNPSAVFVSTPEAIGRLREYAANVDSLEPRLRPVQPKPGERIQMSVNGIDLEALHFHHGGRAENLGLLVDLGGVRFLHAGDTEATPAEIEPYALGKEHLEVAFLPYWLLLEPGWAEALGGARRVVAMHLPAADAPPSYFGPSGSLQGLKDSLRSIDPELVLFDRLLERKTFPLARETPAP
jgi:L-ascorbate metabolism protein UlaG (beta-lactamase superfamily)